MAPVVTSPNGRVEEPVCLYFSPLCVAGNSTTLLGQRWLRVFVAALALTLLVEFSELSPTAPFDNIPITHLPATDFTGCSMVANVTDNNGLGDACEAFRRTDSNDEGTVDLSDRVRSFFTSSRIVSQ